MTRQRMSAAALVAVAALAMTTLAQAAPRMRRGTARRAMSGNPDAMFMKMAAMGGIAEVRMGRLAIQKASRAEVKQFGEMMVHDHGVANQELSSLARQKGVQLPNTMGPEHQAHYNHLARLSGRAFDRAYIKMMVMDHRKVVAAFQKESENGRDEDVKNWAGEKLPTLQEHLNIARSLDQNVLGTGATDNAPH